MELKLKYLKEKFIEKRFLILMGITIVCSLISTKITYIASKYIHSTFNIPPVVKDLIWEHLPYLPILWVSEVLMLLSALYLLIWSFKKNKYYLPYAILIISIFHLFRAFLIVLTPLGFPYEYNGILYNSNKSVLMYGAFPSGHLSIPLLAYLITKKNLALLLTFLVGITLLISRGHYSIDLVGTILLIYPIYKFSENYLKKYFIK